MVKKKATMPKELVAQQECCHYWIIERAEGSISKGVCLFCGVEKKFRNYLSDCLKFDEEGYQEWITRLGYDKEERYPREDVLSQPRGGDKDAVKAGT